MRVGENIGPAVARSSGPIPPSLVPFLIQSFLNYLLTHPNIIFIRAYSRSPHTSEVILFDEHVLLECVHIQYTLKKVAYLYF